ncbi:hypothetical protein M3Y94_00260600 [Aphelenchoides besseyi]|nr:hypothetical protein M3Y94_00260600 [Aphelenchoides besseyi]
MLTAMSRQMFWLQSPRTISLLRFASTSSVNNAPHGIAVNGLVDEVVQPRIVNPKTMMGELNHSVSHNSVDATQIYMFGYGGCVDKHLHQYSKLYEDQGCDVSRYIAPLLNAPSLARAHPFAAEFHANVSEYEKTRPIVFHLLSMNGCMVFTALWELWDKSVAGRELKSRVKGIVFDSCPSDCDLSRSAAALSSTAVPASQNRLDVAMRTGAYAYFYAYFAVQRASAHLQSLIVRPSRFNDYYAYYRLQELDLPKNQLFLYSERDSIIDYQHVDRFIEHQKKSGANVRSKRWTTSNHVSHLRQHRDEYQQLCREFLKETSSC